MLNRKSVVVLFLIALLAQSSCNSVTASKPVVVITEPASGSEFREGDPVKVESTSDDAKAIVRVELVVDGVIVKADPSPTAQGQPSFTLVQSWKATHGSHTIIVRAYNAAGLVSDPVGINVTVLSPVAQAQTLTANPAASTTITSTVPTAKGTRGACTNIATFVSETISDRTNFAAGSAFNKIWRLKNTGTCTWGVGYSFGLVSGEAMASSNLITPPATGPNGTAEIIAPMTAPSAPGLHSSVWQMKNETGQTFGPRVTVIINVTSAIFGPSSTQVSPTTTACSGAPTLSTFTVTTEQITEGATTRIQWGLVTNVSSVQLDPGIGLVSTPGFRDISPKTTTTYTLTAQCGPNVRTAQVIVIVNPTSATMGNFTGTWIDNFGTMAIVQSGSNVLPTSEYINALTLSKSKGNLSGTVTGNTLIGNWSIEGATGALQLYLGADVNTFDGSRTSGQQQLRWCGARPGSQFPLGCSFSGSWNIYYSANLSCTSMILARADDRATGSLCGASLTGTIAYSGSESVMNGTLAAPSGGSPFAFYLLDGFNATQFQGNVSGAELCGWRGNASKPPQCGR